MSNPRNEMVEKNMGLVYYYARRFVSSGLEYEDLVQEGAIGLMDAVDRFDPGRGVKFSTYAMWHVGRRIREAIQNKNDVIRTPKRNSPRKCVGVESAEQVPDDQPPVADTMSDGEEYDAIHRCIKRLPHRDGIVSRLRHGVGTEPRTLREVGNILGVTAERVRQIQTGAEEKLRELMLDCVTLGDHGAVTPERLKESGQTET